MADEENKTLSHEEWLAAERAKLKKGFTYTPPPPSPDVASEATTADQVLAGLGLGGAVVAGTLAPHPNPITFQGIGAPVIANALRSEISDDDTRVQVSRNDEGTVVVISQSQAATPRQFTPALTVTLLQGSDSLTVAVSELRKSTLRGKWGSIASTVIDQGRDVLGSGSGGARGLLDLADGSRIDIVCSLRVDNEAGAITVDYEGTSEARAWGINVVKNYTHAYTTFTVRSVLNPEIPNNHGSLAPIEVRAPEGSAARRARQRSRRRGIAPRILPRLTFAWPATTSWYG